MFIFTLDCFTVSLLHLVDYNCSPKCFRALRSFTEISQCSRTKKKVFQLFSPFGSSILLHNNFNVS